MHPSLAYGEGLAYFWSALVLQDPLIVDWMFPEPWVVDLEQNLFNGVPMTWGTFAPVASTSDLVGVSALHHEELVSSMLWSIYQLFLEETGDWSESILMESLVNELPARIDNGVDVGAIGIDFADFLDSLICSLAGEVELSQWLEQIEAYSRARIAILGIGLTQEKNFVPKKVRKSRCRFNMFMTAVMINLKSHILVF